MAMGSLFLFFIIETVFNLHQAFITPSLYYLEMKCIDIKFGYGTSSI